MNKWEYLEIRVDDNYRRLAIIPPDTVNLDWLLAEYPQFQLKVTGQGVQGESGMTVVRLAIMNHLGADCWEAFAATAHEGVLRFCFKRPLPE